jgi:hypothetical protein
MKKTLLFIPLVVVLLVTSCNEDPIISNESNELGIEYEAIMNEGRAWRLTKVESSKPREFQMSYVKKEDGFPVGIDTVTITGTDWLSQFNEASTYDPANFRTNVLTKLDFTYYQTLTSSMNFSYKLPDEDEFETTGLGNSKSPQDLTVFEVDLSMLHKYFYGYHIDNRTTDQEDDKETWTDFKATENKISFQVQKIYRDTAYLVNVELEAVN